MVPATKLWLKYYHIINPTLVIDHLKCLDSQYGITVTIEIQTDLSVFEYFKLWLLLFVKPVNP